MGDKADEEGKAFETETIQYLASSAKLKRNADNVQSQIVQVGRVVSAKKAEQKAKASLKRKNETLEILKQELHDNSFETLRKKGKKKDKDTPPLRKKPGRPCDESRMYTNDLLASQAPPEMLEAWLAIADDTGKRAKTLLCKSFTSEMTDAEVLQAVKNFLHKRAQKDSWRPPHLKPSSSDELRIVTGMSSSSFQDKAPAEEDDNDDDDNDDEEDDAVDDDDEDDE
jgi:hypothetical protein